MRCSANAHAPLSMLHTAGKLLDSLIRNRFAKTIHAAEERVSGGWNHVGNAFHDSLLRPDMPGGGSRLVDYVNNIASLVGDTLLNKRKADLTY